MSAADAEFWSALDRLVANSRLVLDRPRGSRHPRFPERIYPLDYGYLDGTAAADGGGIDAWLGALGDRRLTAVLLTVDLLKRDTELKLLLGCTPPEQRTALEFQKSGTQRAILVDRPHPTSEES